MTLLDRGHQTIMPPSMHECKTPGRRDRKKYSLERGAKWRCWCGDEWTFTTVNGWNDKCRDSYLRDQDMYVELHLRWHRDRLWRK